MLLSEFVPEDNQEEWPIKYQLFRDRKTGQLRLLCYDPRWDRLSSSSMPQLPFRALRPLLVECGAHLRRGEFMDVTEQIKNEMNFF